MMDIRRAREADLDAICRLSDQINAEHHSHLPQDFIQPDGTGHDRPYWRDFIGKGNAAVMVADDDGELLGVVAVYVSSAAPFPFIVSRLRGHVATIVVEREARGRGIGRKLMAAAEAFVRSAGADDVRLEVMAFNTSALTFYEEIGYESFSHRLTKRLSPGASVKGDDG